MTKPYKIVSITTNEDYDCGDCFWWNCARLGCCMCPFRGEYSKLPDGLKPCKHFKINDR